MRHVHLGLAATLALVVSCSDSSDGRRSFTSPNGQDPAAASFSLSSRADEPAGLSLITQRQFSTRATSLTDTAGSQGWATDERSYLGIVDDPAAPMSPSKVGELTWATGLTNGGPGALWYNFKSGYRTVYAAMWVKLSSNFQGNASSYNQMAMMWQAGLPRVILQLKGAGTGALTPAVVFNSTADSRQRLAATTPVTVSRGDWHLWEVVVRINNAGKSDGALVWYVDGVPALNYADLRVIGTNERDTWDSFYLSPTWNSGDVVRQAMTLRIDQTYISGSPNRVELAPATPAPSPLPAPVATVRVSPAADTLDIGGTKQLSAVASDSTGVSLTGRSIAWSSADTTIARVSSTGLVTAIRGGTTTISATSEGKRGSNTTIVRSPVTPPTTPPSSSGQQVFADDFESGSFAKWTDGYNSSLHRIVSDASFAHTGSRYLDVTYPQGSGGGFLNAWFMPGYDSATVSYWVRLPSNWVGGGYLVGLYANRTDNMWSAFGKAGVCPTGSDYFTAFLFNETAGNPGPTHFYSYFPGMTRSGSQCWGNTSGAGSRYVNETAMTRGAWHHVEFFVKANTPGQSDGVERFWIDGVLHGEWTGLMQRTTRDLMLNAIQLTFNVASGSPQTQHVYVDDVEVRTGATATSPAPSPAPVASVSVALNASSLTAGQTTQASATLRDASGNALTGRSIAWTSSNTSVATVSSTGVVTSVAAGSAQITATSEGQTGAATLTVNAPAPSPVASVSVSLGSGSLTSGQTTQATATLRDAQSNVLSGRAVVWTSSAPNVATVASNGVVTAVGAGTAQIVATSEGRSGSATLTVTAPAPAPVASVAVSLSSASLVAGLTTQATATLRDAAGNILTGRTITWTSSAPSVATVSSTGVVATLVAGTAQITATSEGRSGSAMVTVSAPSSGGGGGNVPLVFASDFSTGLGNSQAAVTDASKSIHWNDWHPDADQLYVVSAAGLGFPAGINNALRTRYMGYNSADVKTLNQWPEPATGGSMYFRIYYRLDIPNSYGNLPSGGHHPIEPVPGACPFQFEYRIGSNANGTMDFKATLPTGDYVQTLNKFQTYRFEWAFKNRTSAGAYKFEIRVYDASGAQIGSNSTFHRMNSTITLGQDNPDVPLASDCIRALTIGSNGPTGWETVGTSAADAFSYLSGVAISQVNWIGPYVAGEHR